jgi:hypothetical protein
MALSQTTAPTAAKPPLEAGDIAPAFRLASGSGEGIDPASDLVAGKPLLLLFRAGDALPPDLSNGRLEGLLSALKALDGRAVLATALGETASLDGFESAADPEGTVRSLFGVTGAARLVLIAPNRHIAYIGGDAEAAQAALAKIAATRDTVSMTSHPPVLILPDVLSRADCQKLINIFAMQGQTYVEPGHGTLPPGNSDYKQKIPEYGRKDRVDHWIRQPETNAFIDDRLSRRLFPEIQKCFQYKITRREAYRIGSYEGERGGELHGHRDNTKAMVAHRRFACSINLNTEQFEGGELRYPEFGNQLYRPETGAAITFSCSLLHEPMHVTKGRRFVLLAFLYGET